MSTSLSILMAAALQNAHLYFSYAFATTSLHSAHLYKCGLLGVYILEYHNLDLVYYHVAKIIDVQKYVDDLTDINRDDKIACLQILRNNMP